MNESIFPSEHNVVTEYSGSFLFVLFYDCQITDWNTSISYPSCHYYTSFCYGCSWIRWGLPEYLLTRHFSLVASLNLDFHKNQYDLTVSISEKSLGDLVSKFKLSAGPQPRYPLTCGSNLKLTSNVHDSVSITLHLSLHSICLQTPTHSCQLVALKSHFKKECRFIGFSSLGCPRKVIRISVKASKSYLLMLF